MSSMNMKKKTLLTLRRARRTRARIHGTALRPRMSVKKSLNHMSVQLINDDLGVTICSASDRTMKEKATKTERSAQVGTEIAKLAQAAGITQVVFDRGAARYQGRIRALAEAARESGLNF